MSIATCTTVVGVFKERSAADRAIDDLGKVGFGKDKIGVIDCDPQGKAVVKNKGEAETHTRNGAITGAVAGAAIGALVGLAVQAGVIPVIGPAIGTGTVGMMLTNAVGGAAIAALGGAMIGRCFLTERAKYYGRRILVTVRTDGHCLKASTILESQGGYDPQSVATSREPKYETNNSLTRNDQ